jgi:hypothetical protein
LARKHWIICTSRFFRLVANSHRGVTLVSEIVRRKSVGIASIPFPNPPQLHRAFFHCGGVAVDADGELEGGLVLRGDDLRERDLICVSAT